MTYLFPQDLEGLAKGLIWGDDSQLSRETIILFRVLGASHFLAASGANLSSLQAIILRFFPRYAPRTVSIVLACLLLWYVVTVNEASLWRAFGFWLISLVSQVFGRVAGFFRALIILLSAIFLLSPELLHSIGFQLSLAATCGLFFSRIFMPSENINESIEGGGYLRLASLSLVRSWIICIFVTPVSWWHFGSFAVLSSFSTFVLSPVLGLLFSIAFLWEVASSIEHFLGLQMMGSSLVWSCFRAISWVLDFFLHPLVWLANRTFLSWGLFLFLSAFSIKQLLQDRSKDA